MTLEGKIIYTKTSLNGTKFELVEEPGQKKYIFDKEGKDRRYSIILTPPEHISNDSTKIKYSYTHGDVGELMKAILNNDILLPQFQKNLKDYRGILTELEVNR